ncbi:hypothetical protein BGE01nite_56690 [Brevifollis gellanilyticus]|uniref:Uncharacterized protein n=1 Tax=Brevifollis gellanilyticus TaxID=748831 RepID=A0A512MI29_9BACT|nr:hypothetical protein BGE01nite_56690 [Brevifollis gellanilyticus]
MGHGGWVGVLVAMTVLMLMLMRMVVFVLAEFFEAFGEVGGDEGLEQDFFTRAVIAFESVFGELGLVELEGGDEDLPLLRGAVDAGGMRVQAGGHVEVHGLSGDGAGLDWL